jgi:hypothetical protein
VPYYAFNDVFATMAYIGAGRLSDAAALIEDRRVWIVDAPHNISNVQMTADIGIPVCQALLDFGRGDHAAVVAGLLPIRSRINEFGGSHAQRDAVQRTLVQSALRSGATELAGALLSERLNVKPASSWNWRSKACLDNLLGNELAAVNADATATVLAASGDA